MTEEKIKRITAATTVGAVVLLCFLIFVFVFQTIKISAAKKLEAEYDAQISYLEELRDEGADKIDLHKQSLIVQALARELGYDFDMDRYVND